MAAPHTASRAQARNSGSASVLVLASLALSAVLLAHAGPLLGSVTAAARATLGFAPGRALVIQLDASRSGRDTESERRFRAQLLERVELLRHSESTAVPACGITTTVALRRSTADFTIATPEL
jgi:hypothetical protein